MSEVERVLAAHLWHHTRDRHCACGFRTPLAQLAVEGYVAHVAEQIEALIAERVRAAQAEALRDTAERADSIGHHWSGVTAHAFFDFASDLRDRIAQDAPESAPTAPLTASGVQSGLGDGESWYETPDDAIYPDVLTGRIEGLEGNQR